jgi:hypothetical protein
MTHVSPGLIIVTVVPVLALPALYMIASISWSPTLAPISAALVAWPLSVLVANTRPLSGS